MSAPAVKTRPAPGPERGRAWRSRRTWPRHSVVLAGPLANALRSGMAMLAREALLLRRLGRARGHAGPRLALPHLERAPDPLQRDPAIAKLRTVVSRHAHDAARPVGHAHRR